MMEPPRLLMVFFFVLGPQFPSPTVSQDRYGFPCFNSGRVIAGQFPSHIRDRYCNTNYGAPVADPVTEPAPNPPSADPTDSCPVDNTNSLIFTKNNGNCFHFSTDQASWTDARTKCQTLGQKYGLRFDLAELGNPNNLGSDVWLMETIARKGYRSWLGGYSPSENNQWTWAYTGRPLPLAFPSWGPNEPNGDGWCVDAHNFGNRYYLNDLNCTQQHNYVCQQFP